MTPQAPETQHISATVRRLRTEQGFTQRELAQHLGISQGRLSQLERGGGSFSAEQLITMLRLFDVDIDAFDPLPSSDGSLQNALIRFGARHLRPDPDARVLEEHNSATRALLAVLLTPASPRFLTALAPVLLWSCDQLSLPAIQDRLVQAGAPHRLPWLVENTLEAIGQERPETTDWRRQIERGSMVGTIFLNHLAVPAQDAPLDPIDRGIRTLRSQQEAVAEASAITRKWRLVTMLQVHDFARALMQALQAAP